MADRLMSSAPALAAATLAAQAWGGAKTPPRLVHQRENAVYDVQLKSGWRAALRLHRPGYQTPDAIRSELRWTERLADTGFACPWPLRTESGDLIHEVAEGQVATAIQWIDGQPIGETGVPFDGNFDEQVEIYRDLGRLLADLHDTSDMTAPEDLTRPKWDAPALCSSEAPLWGRFWENPALTPRDANLLCEARDAARSRLDEIGTTGTGLIHADVLQENVLRYDGLLFLIDFDDGGYGYRLYDLATALIQHAECPRQPALADALVEGYLDGNGPIDGDSFDDLPMFVMLRAMASAGWIISRAGPEDPRQALYAERAVRRAEAFLAS